jgi:hypothetical protein
MELTHGDSEIEVFTESQDLFEGQEHIETENHENHITDQGHGESQGFDKNQNDDKSQVGETEAPLVGESDGTQRCARSQREHLQEQRSQEDRGIAQAIGGT